MEAQLNFLCLNTMCRPDSLATLPVSSNSNAGCQWMYDDGQCLGDSVKIDDNGAIILYNTSIGMVGAI